MQDLRIALLIYTLFSASLLLGSSSEAFALPTSLLSFDEFSYDGKTELVKYKNLSQPSIKESPPLNQNLYHQNAGVDPAGWLLGGQALDEAASALARPYYEQYGYHSIPRNYLYYDWGW